jgi:tetratricopeptide (TPR) repeat protein
VEMPEERAPGRNIPRELSRIAMRALAPDPEQRYPDVASFEQALRDYLAHQEALRLAEEGDRALEVLEREAGLGRGERYAAYAEALGRYGQALYLWSDNEHAAEGQARAAMAYADEALASGDVGLAAAQLGVLERNRHAEVSRVAAIRAAVERRSAGRSRQVVAALVVAALVVAAWTSRAAWQRWEEEKRHLVELRIERDRQVVAAFTSARDSDRAELARLRHRLSSGEFAKLGDQADLVDEVIWTEQVLLWSQGRWGELWDSLCTMPAVGRHALTLRREVLAVPGLAGSVMGAWLKSTEGTTGAALCRAFAEALRVGVAPSVVERASLLLVRPRGEQAQGAAGPAAAGAGGGMPAWIESVTGRRERREERRAVLLRAALFGVALEAARERSDQEAAQVLVTHLLPFRLAAVPFGPAASGLPVEAPQLLRGADGEWLALEPAMGGERWRSLPWGQNKTVFTSLGMNDGSVVIAGEGQLVRLGGARGDVLGRVMLGGRPVLLWPDPLDRTRLVVTVLTDQQRGYVEELSFREGRSEEALLPGELLASPTYDGALVLRRRLREAALGELGLKPQEMTELGNLFSKERRQAVRADPRRAAVERQVFAGLRAALERDPRNPDLWLMSLALMPDETPPEERIVLARGVVEAAAELTPFGALRLGVNLEREGFVAAADEVYKRAGQRFLELGGNADLASMLVGSPLVYLRQLGGEHFRAGRVDRALQLVETGRRFAGYVEGDNRFYHLYVRWLEKNGRQAEARRIAPRVVESEEAGGVALRPSGFIVGVDVLLFVVLLCPPLLFWLVLRAWRRARSTQKADMHARGMRTRWERTVAFAIHPVERLGCIFLAYTPRSERLAIFAISAVFLVATAFIAGSIRTVAEIAAVPLYVANGYPGNGGLLRHLEERLREGKGGVPELRLWAEGQREHGQVAAARAALERVLAIQPEDPVARNNLAVLDEEAGRTEAARTGYARAAASPKGPGGPEGPGGPGHPGHPGQVVARYNQARLAGEGKQVDEARAALAWRDRLHAEHLGNSRPLWARTGYHDLIAVLIGLESVVARSWSAFVALLNGNFGAIGEVFGQSSDASASDVRTFLIDAGGYGAIFFGLLALLALPFAVRPVAPGSAIETQGRSPRRRLLRHLVGRLFGLLALLFPGLHDLVRGKAALGALQVLIIAAAWGAHSTLLHGGLLGSMTQLSLNQDYFPGIEEVFYPELAWVGQLAAALLIALFVVNLPLTYWRQQRAAARART